MHNPQHVRGGELTSLACARPALQRDSVILYGDLLFRSYVLRDLLEQRGEIVAVIDSALPAEDSRDYRDLAWCTRADDRLPIQEDVELVRIENHASPGGGRPHGRWIGMLGVRGKGRLWLEEALAQLLARPDFETLGMGDLLNHLIACGQPVKVFYIHGHWLDVDSLEDVCRASDFTHGADAVHPAGEVP